jgi:tetratricopeptide (TPR) repeat protein
VGSKFAGLAAATLIALASPWAHAESAAELVDQGLAAYKAGDYPAAITALAKAQELEPSFDTQFALAQAYRLASQCEQALPHYKALLDASTDLSTGRLIQTSMALCVPPEPEKPPPPPPPEPPPPPPPKIIVREGPPSLLMIGLIGSGAVMFGSSVGWFLASHENREDADAAQTFDAHQKIQNRADRQRVYGYITLAASAGLIGYAVYRFKFKSASTEVALAPSAEGATLVARGRF